MPSDPSLSAAGTPPCSCFACVGKTFEHGDFARPLPSGNVHIVIKDRGTGFYEMACGKTWWQADLVPADGDGPRQCAKCWESM